MNYQGFEMIEKAMVYDPHEVHLVRLALEFGIELDMREEAARVIRTIVPFNPGLAWIPELILNPEISLDDIL
jgi:hypothetical protein